MMRLDERNQRWSKQTAGGEMAENEISSAHSSDMRVLTYPSLMMIVVYRKQLRLLLLSGPLHILSSPATFRIIMYFY